jgi:hypothetical protein
MDAYNERGRFLGLIGEKVGYKTYVLYLMTLNVYIYFKV